MKSCCMHVYTSSRRAFLTPPRGGKSRWTCPVLQFLGLCGVVGGTHVANTELSISPPHKGTTGGGLDFKVLCPFCPRTSGGDDSPLVVRFPPPFTSNDCILVLSSSPCPWCSPAPCDRFLMIILIIRICPTCLLKAGEDGLIR